MAQPCRHTVHLEGGALITSRHNSEIRKAGPSSTQEPSQVHETVLHPSHRRGERLGNTMSIIRSTSVGSRLAGASLAQPSTRGHRGADRILSRRHKVRHRLRIALLPRPPQHPRALWFSFPSTLCIHAGTQLRSTRVAPHAATPTCARTDQCHARASPTRGTPVPREAAPLMSMQRGGAGDAGGALRGGVSEQA